MPRNTPANIPCPPKEAWITATTIEGLVVEGKEHGGFNCGSNHYTVEQVKIAIQLGASLARSGQTIGAAREKGYPRRFFSGGREEEPEITFDAMIMDIWNAWNETRKVLAISVDPPDPSPLIEFPIMGSVEYYRGEKETQGRDRVIFIIPDPLANTAVFCGLTTHGFKAFGLELKSKNGTMLCLCE